MSETENPVLDPVAELAQDWFDKSIIRTAAAHEGHIYAIAETGTRVVKIGFAKDVTMRLRELQCGNPRRLYVAGWDWHPRAFLLERAFHRRLKLDRVSGEWFARTAIVDELIGAMHGKRGVYPWLCRYIPEEVGE